MHFIERFGNFIPDNLKPPIAPISYADFVNTLRTENATRVTAVPGRKTLFRTGSDIGEDGAHYEYNITFNARGQGGRRINYYYPCIQKFLDNPDFQYAHGGKMRGERLIHDLEEAYSLTTIVTADTKLQEIQRMLPDCTVELTDADRTFTQEDLEELRREAQQRQIRPWDVLMPDSNP